MAPNGLKWPKNDPKWLKIAQKWHFWNVAIYAFRQAQIFCCQAPKTILHPWVLHFLTISNSVWFSGGKLCDLLSDQTPVCQCQLESQKGARNWNKRYIDSSVILRNLQLSLCFLSSTSMDQSALRSCTEQRNWHPCDRNSWFSRQHYPRKLILILYSRKV